MSKFYETWFTSFQGSWSTFQTSLTFVLQIFDRHRDSTLRQRPTESVRHYGNTYCGVFKRGVQNKKDFCIRINILKGNYWILRTKNVNNKKCAPKLIFFNENEKDSDNFWLRKLNTGTFWHLPINPILKIQ